jgi:hypothetical protein
VIAVDPGFADALQQLVANAQAAGASGQAVQGRDVGQVVGTLNQHAGQDAVGRDKISYATPPPPASPVDRQG